MAVDSRNPLYAEMSPDWEQMRDTYRGERIVKSRGFKYLPATSGMREDGIAGAASPGQMAYDAYRVRARFPDLVKEAVESMLGVLHRRPPKIDLPPKLEALRDKATLRNESLEMLLRRINEEQMITGRTGIMLEVPESAGIALPFIALYRAEDMINWDDGSRDQVELDSLNLVVIDESEDERQASFEWERVEKYRVLILGDPEMNEPVGSGVYRVGVFREGAGFNEAALITPSIGGTALDRIPFVFINTKDITATPDQAPMLGLSNLSLTIYRGEADYRQSLFNQGQDTLVTIGAPESEGGQRRIGAGAEIALPPGQGNDAKFIGVDSSGLEEMRLALENDYTRGHEASRGLQQSVTSGAESGDALRIRVAARTASLNQIALAGAYGLQELLRMAAVWVGADPEAVIVEPNLDFVADIMPGRELTDVMAAKQMGAPLSLRSIHEMEQERGLTSRTFEEELEEMQEELDAGMPGATPAPEDSSGSTNPDGPVGDDDEEDDDEGEADPNAGAE